MRLTLRTMLAYMDGILEPEDAADIEKKIEESEYATNLLHRTRDVMRRLRLAAPGLRGDRPRLDPNTVAEYLDNVLEGDRVTDFEKVCLDSDVHLAEVSSSHQILTLVLGEPAEIEPASRERMYRMIEQVSAEAEAAKDVAAEGAALAERWPSEPPPPRPRQRPTVPDYLRGPPRKRRWRSAAVGVAVAVALGVIALVATGQFEPNTFLGNLLGMKGPEAEPVAQRPAVPSEGPVLPPQPPSPEDGLLPEPPVEDRSPEQPGELAPGPLPSVEPSPDKPSEPEPPAETADVAAEPGPVEPAIGKPVEPDTPAEDGDGAATPGEAPPVEPGAELGQPPGEPGESAEPPIAPPDEQAPRQRMGRYMSEGQVLLQYDGSAKRWQRIASKKLLLSSVPLVVLPIYHAEVMLTAGVNLQVIGPARVELLPGDAQRPVGLKVDYGRVLMMPLAEAGTQLRVLAGGAAGVVTFADGDSVAGLEVVPVRAPGTDPEKTPSIIVADLYAKSGKILWDEGGERPAFVLEPNSLLALDARPPRPPVPVSELPKWCIEDPVNCLNPLDRRASVKLEEALRLAASDGSDDPVVKGLIESTVHRQKEIRRLAVQCLGDIGQFDPLVGALNEPDYGLGWPDFYIEQLQRAIARGPEVAQAVGAAIEKRYREEGATLYRMLWGYRQEDLDKGKQDRTLVDQLTHKALAFRVLGYWNLNKITGWTLRYDPTASIPDNQPSVRNWRKRLEAGEIRFREPKAKQKDARPRVPPPATAAEPAPEAIVEPPAGSGERLP